MAWLNIGMKGSLEVCIFFFFFCDNRALMVAKTGNCNLKKLQFPVVGNDWKLITTAYCLKNVLLAPTVYTQIGYTVTDWGKCWRRFFVPQTCFISRRLSCLRKKRHSYSELTTACTLAYMQIAKERGPKAIKKKKLISRTLAVQCYCKHHTWQP